MGGIIADIRIGRILRRKFELTCSSVWLPSTLKLQDKEKTYNAFVKVCGMRRESAVSISAGYHVETFPG